MSRWVLAGWILAASLTVVTILVLTVDSVTSSPQLCATCHEMRLRELTWSHSPHVEVACVQCHQPARPWYALPQRLIDRAELLGRDLSLHLSGRYSDTDWTVVRSSSVPDAICLQCHSPNRKATSGFRIKIDHARHAKLNGSCVSCHVRTAHPSATRSTALSLMTQCYTCHGTSRNPKASGACGLCHPSGFALFPASHKAAAWKLRHGRVATADPRQCSMCHQQSFCDRCHGLAMPHPVGWDKRQGHGLVAQQDPALCSRCHRNVPQMCSMCHHGSYDTTRGPWVKQHPIAVDRRGAEYCIGCHSPLYCVTCHRAERSEPSTTPVRP